MSTCDLIERRRQQRPHAVEAEEGWFSVVAPVASKHGDVEREDAQRFALLVQEWTRDWNSERDRSYKLP